MRRTASAAQTGTSASVSPPSETRSVPTRAPSSTGAGTEAGRVSAYEGSPPFGASRLSGPSYRSGTVSRRPRATGRAGSAFSARSGIRRKEAKA